MTKRFPHFKQILADAKFRTVTVLLQDDLVRDIKNSLYLLWGGVLFVLVIGCVNLANLMMVRSASRKREMATRHAIGGDLGRLARQLLTETTVLAASAGLAGVLLAGGARDRWRRSISISCPEATKSSSIQSVLGSRSRSSLASASSSASRRRSGFAT
jgi:hypothetical protein